MSGLGGDASAQDCSARDGEPDVAGSEHDLLQAEQPAVLPALDLKVARRMFWCGFALLPGLWLLVWVHFRKVAREPHSDPLLQVYVQRSLIGASVSGMLLACWVVVVQATWREWNPRWQWLMAVAPPEEETTW